ncbi:MAG: hypothetical protein Q4D40_04085 [Eubacteriales bacterium]|nr:hypothetical protein [Eubacteriales bacterium]
MKYTKDERIDIGRQVVTQELARKEAMAKYDIGSTFMDKYIRLYKESEGIPTKQPVVSSKHSIITNSSAPADIDAYMAMSKEELINELIKAKANELRAKKGYEVK